MLTKPIIASKLKNTLINVISKSNLEIFEKTKLEENNSILVVEDNEVNQFLLEKILLGFEKDFKIYKAMNGLEAIEKFKERSYKIILMDIAMPLMDGIDATKNIRKIEKENNLIETPIVAITAHALSGVREECIEAGMNDYMTKPMDRFLLESLIKKYKKNKNNHQN